MGVLESDIFWEFPRVPRVPWDSRGNGSQFHFQSRDWAGAGVKVSGSGKAAGAKSRKSMGVDGKMSKTFVLKCYEVLIGQI